jgi:drug/metabolite transporter (DMT)-like permease
MSWLIIAILSYLLSALVSVFDKYLLNQKIPNYRIYAFYVGVINFLVLFLIPFFGLELPQIKIIILALLTGAISIFAIFWLYKAIFLYEVSQVAPLIGGILPFFTLILTYFFSQGKATLNFYQFLAFLFLVSGTFLITYKKGKGINFSVLKISLFAALVFSFYFVLLKYLFLNLNFWSGVIWTRIGSFLMALLIFLSFKEVRREVFKKRERISPFNVFQTTPFLFILTRISAGLSGLLQILAVFLAPLGLVAFINALEGVRYVFLFLLTSFFSFKVPQFIKEDISKISFLQKFLAILLITLAIAILSFSETKFHFFGII